MDNETINETQTVTGSTPTTDSRILGLHHITAIAGNARRNHEFYTRVLGLRMVKKTVNFDDPETYHFYFGNEVGEPGTILTFFPWEGIVPGRIGTGMATEIGYSVPKGSLEFWKERLTRFNVKQEPVGERFGEQFLAFQDPDGLKINLIVPAAEDKRKPWVTEEVAEANALRGFHSITLMLKNNKPTAAILTGIFGYQLTGQEGSRSRYATDAIGTASVVDLVEAPLTMTGHVAGGTNHHVAFRVKNDKILMDYREKIVQKGLHITEKIDRDYFFSLYFREPGGVLFELATENPGFDRDEPVSELGTHLKLPARYEAERAKIEAVLPKLG
ncbi:MAG TPA: ring-cleaving dioxygenase [Puia sp.]|nr:ring-cleaving dioxygenase [Puia sp.]